MPDDTPKLDLPVEMCLEDCCQCGVRFGLPKHLQDQFKKDHRLFCCPSGHQQHYTGTSDKDIAKDFRSSLERISKLDVGVILNKHSLELAIEIAKQALEKHK